jgi:adenine-specific DNA-methyltransferase
MPFLDWVNKSQAKETTREVPYHLLKQEAAYGEPSDNLLIQGDNRKRPAIPPLRSEA